MINKLFSYFKLFFFKLKNLTLKIGFGLQHIIQVIVDSLEKNKLINKLINFIVNNFIIISFLVLFLLNIFFIFMFDESFLNYLKDLKLGSDLIGSEKLNILRFIVIYFKFIEISSVFFLGFFVCFIVYNKLFLENNNDKDNNILSKNKKIFINFFFFYIVSVVVSIGFLFLLNCFLYNKINYSDFVLLYKEFIDEIPNDVKNYGIFFSINYYLLSLIFNFINIFIYYYYIQRFVKIEKINIIIKLIFYLIIIIFLFLLLLYILLFIIKCGFLFKAYAMEDIALADCQNDLKDYLNPKPKVIDVLYENEMFKTLLKKNKMGLIDFTNNNINYETFCVPLETYNKLKPCFRSGLCSFIPKKYVVQKYQCMGFVEVMSGHWELILLDNEEFKCTPIFNKDEANIIIKKIKTHVYESFEKELEKSNNDKNDLS